MPVRSLNSSVLKWPELEVVLAAIKNWARETVSAHAEIQQIGYFGSYARGNWGVGSDLDIIIVVDHCEHPFWQRSRHYDTFSLPIHTEVLVYTQEEWSSLASRQPGFYNTLMREAVWIYNKHTNDH